VKQNFNLEVLCLVLANGVNKLAIAAVLIALPAAAGSEASTTSSHHTSSTASKSHLKRTSLRQKRVRGQKAIDATRVREIQSALIREHYMDGQPTGTWDPRTKAAMTKYQGDNGWQTKKVPDSRAIIKLGLGPDRADLINPNTAFVMPLPSGKGGAAQQATQPQQ